MPKSAMFLLCLLGAGRSIMCLTKFVMLLFIGLKSPTNKVDFLRSDPRSPYIILYPKLPFTIMQPSKFIPSFVSN